VLSNFTTHLKRLHKEKWTTTTDSRTKRRSHCGGKRKAESSNSSTNPNEPPAKLQQTKLFRTVAVVSQTEVDQLVTSYVVKGMHPLSVVEEPAFVELVTGLCPSANVMSRRTLGRRVDDMFKSKMLVVKDELCKHEHVCTTADVWSTSKRSYMGVTCHWVDADTLLRRSVALACRRFKGSHTFDRIAELLYDINKEFGLDHKKLLPQSLIMARIS